MPKLKTKSGAKKRFKLTATGKVKTARFYFDRLLPKTVSLAEGIRSGSDAMMAPAANEI